jgi:hypothetical protein
MIAASAQPAQKNLKHLKLTFRDSVAASRKTSNSGGMVTNTSDTRVGSTKFGDGKIQL